MEYVNILTITMETEELAIKAMDILKERLGAGFECDEMYRIIPSKKMAEDLILIDNEITLPENSGYSAPEEANDVIAELMKCLAAKMDGACIICEAYNFSDYVGNELFAILENGTLRIERNESPYFYDEEGTEPVLKVGEFSF